MTRRLQARRVVSGLLAAAAFAALVPAVASAGQIVYRHGDDLWAMNDDGTNQRAFLHAGTDVSGMSTLGNPDVARDGSLVVFDGTWTGAFAEETKWTPHAPAACGTNCTGVYRYNGTVTRLSASPQPCPLNPCASFETEPELTAGGRILSAYAFYNENYGCNGFSCDWQIDAVDGRIFSRDATTGDKTEPFSRCTDATGPSPNPANPAQFAYVGCKALDATASSVPAIIVSTGTQASESAPSFDDVAQSDPSWSLDGSRIVDAEGGDSPGLWASPSTLSSTPSDYVYLLPAPANTSFGSPRYISGGRIAFDATQNGSTDIWTIPTSCNMCTFPSSATRLTTTGGTELAWTPADSLPSPPSAGGSTQGGGTGGGGTGQNTQNTQNTASTTPLVTIASRSAKVKRGRVAITVGCPRSELRCTGTLRLEATLPARARVSAAAKARRVTLGSSHFTIKGGKKVAVSVKLSSAALKVLKRGKSLKATVTAQARGGSGQVRITKASITLHR